MSHLEDINEMLLFEVLEVMCNNFWFAGVKDLG
jgi:hypothetical protein